MLTALLTRDKWSSSNQYSLHNGPEIFSDLKSKLEESQASIKVAATWFTDNELFQILVSKKKQSESVKIEIVLDDNKENYWLPFMELVNLGCTVKLSRGAGANGRMHQKFCIIDDNVLINGSYNWSRNARTENHENVIVSNVRATVAEFNTEFQKLLSNSIDYTSENVPANSVIQSTNDDGIDENEGFKQEFGKVLDEMVYASVVEYNKETLAQKGFDRSQSCAGDSNIIHNELDTVYTEMLNSISASERKKEIILARVATHLEEGKSSLKEKYGRNKEFLLEESEAFIKIIVDKINTTKEINHILKEEIIKIETSDIVNNENKIAELTESRNAKQNEIVKMPFRWYVDIPTYLGLLAVFAYVLLFYSSAAYILLFSEQVAKTQRDQGIPVEKIGIYFPDALARASEQGFGYLLPILLIPCFLVVGIIYLKKLKSTCPNWVIKLICFILIDGFTAIAVTKSIHENDYIAGINSEHFKLENIFVDMNFYLVFIFGMLSLLIFDLVLTYFINTLQNRNDVHLRSKKLAAIALLDNEINLINRNKVDLRGLIAKKNETIEYNLVTISSHENEIQQQSITVGRKINLLENETASQISNLENIVKIAVTKIENELFNFSTHFIKDRINIFLQGWNNFIYSYYAKLIAEAKVQEAKSNSESWFQAHLSKTTY